MRSISRVQLAAVALAALVAAAAAPAPAATPDEVARAIDKARDFLYRKEHGDNWEFSPKMDKGPGFSESGGQWGGVTSLCVWSLLQSGESPLDPKLKSAVDWLKKARITGVYALGTRCQVWRLLPRSPEVSRLARDDAEQLARGLNPAGPAKNLYGYMTTPRDPNLQDHSSSQFGVLGTWACEQIVPELVPTGYWKGVDARWAADQQSDGGWLYHNEPFDTGDHLHTGTQVSMTAAGVATLYLTQDYARRELGARCNGNVVNANIERGLKYLIDHKDQWAPDTARFGTPANEWYAAYTLFGIERVAVASGLKYLGPVDWYQWGADWCIKNQSDGGAIKADEDVDNTALALLFLARGQAPVLINKVQYGDAAAAPTQGHWNERPRDVANFVKWFARQSERGDLNWQITNLDVPEAELHDAPFLYFAGNLPVRLTAEQKRKVKAFAEAGGMLLFNADCPTPAAGGKASGPFVASVASLMGELFPAAEFRDLPADHPIYADQPFSPKKWKQPPVLRGLSNGVRELAILLPDDPARAFQLQQSVGTGREEAYQSLYDIVLYGTDKRPLRTRGTPFLVAREDVVHPTRTIKVGRLKYAGNWDPEPGGWRRLASVMHNRGTADLDVQPVEFGHDQLAGLPVVHLTGTTRFKLADTQRDELKRYVAGGGTLLVDVAGGNAAFAQAAEGLLGSLYPNALHDPLPPADPVFTAFDGKVPVRYRPYATQMLGKLNVPQLRAITVNDRPAVYYSREDLSGGLVGEPIDGIIGYDPETATDIVAGVILTAAGTK